MVAFTPFFRSTLVGKQHIIGDLAQVFSQMIMIVAPTIVINTGHKEGFDFRTIARKINRRELNGVGSRNQIGNDIPCITSITGLYCRSAGFFAIDTNHRFPDSINRRRRVISRTPDFNEILFCHNPITGEVGDRLSIILRNQHLAKVDHWRNPISLAIGYDAQSQTTTSAWTVASNGNVVGFT